MKFFNAIYPYGLNSDVFNKNVKTFLSLDIKYKNPNYVSTYTLLSHQLNNNNNNNNKTTRIKRGKSKISMTIKEINMLQKEFLSNFNCQSVCKFLFGIKKKFLATYYYIHIISCTFSISWIIICIYFHSLSILRNKGLKIYFPITSHMSGIFEKAYFNYSMICEIIYLYALF